MRNKSLISIWAVFLTVFVYGCAGQSDKAINEQDTQFLTLIPVADMNQSLHLKVDSTRQYFSPDAEIPLIVENGSSHFISLNPKTRFRLFIHTEEQWLEVENGNTYIEETLSPPGDPTLNLDFASVKPLLDETSLPSENAVVRLRIVVIGEILSGNTSTGKIVAAYTDVSLKQGLTQQTTVITESTDHSIPANKGKIAGVVRAPDETNLPLPDVVIELHLHPFYNGNQSKVIATTISDTDGKFLFDNLEPGIYTFQTKFLLERGGACVHLDLTKIIRVNGGTVTNIDFNLACPSF